MVRRLWLNRYLVLVNGFFCFINASWQTNRVYFSIACLIVFCLLIHLPICWSITLFMLTCSAGDRYVPLNTLVTITIIVPIWPFTDAWWEFKIEQTDNYWLSTGLSIQDNLQNLLFYYFTMTLKYRNTVSFFFQVHLEYLCWVNLKLVQGTINQDHWIIGSAYIICDHYLCLFILKPLKMVDQFFLVLLKCL